MNLSCVNEHIRIYAERTTSLINIYMETIDTTNSIIAFQQNCYFKLRNTLAMFNYAIRGESCFEYVDILHIYAFLKSQVFDSYHEISYDEIISNKFANKIPITINEFIGLYVYSLNNNLIYCENNILLKKYKIKKIVQDDLIEKVRFRKLMRDYEKNQKKYENNYLDKLLGNRELVKYFSEFI